MGRGRNYLVHGVLAALAALALIPFYIAFFHPNNHQRNAHGRSRKKARDAMPLFMKGSLHLVDVVDSRDGTAQQVPYYRCSGDSTSTTTTRSIVLLHGARYTKEDWKKSGILSEFCANGFTAMALDLNVQTSADTLLIVLSQLSYRGLIPAEQPIDAIITPSASGYTIMDGLVHGKADALRRRIKRWIPVATNGALQYSESDVADAKGWPILAVYGDQDNAGKLSSRLWKQVANAKVVELTVRLGHHQSSSRHSTTRHRRRHHYCISLDAVATTLT
jgi:hypothetical protein